MTLPDLTAYGGGGITLIVALFIVLQELKRQYSVLRYWLPLIVLGLSLALVVSLLYVPKLFMVLGGTVILAALVFMSHGTVKTVTAPQPPTNDDPSKAA